MAKAQHGFNRLTGFIEVYPPDTTFANSLPWKVLVQNSPTSISYNFGNGASSNPTIERMDALNAVNIKSSFKTLTDTCEIVVPRFDQWIMKDSRNINNFSVFDPSAEAENLLFAKGNVVRVFLGYDDVDKLMFHGYISEISATSPIKIKLEDAMWRLKQKTINSSYLPTGGRKEVRLEDFIHDILDGTGVQLGSSVLTEEVTFGKKVVFRNSTVARVMDDIKKRGLSVFMELGKLIIGRTYFDSTLTPHISTKSNSGYKPPIINTEWNVPKGGNNLRVNTMDKRTNMVVVQVFVGNSRVLQMGVVLKPNGTEDVFIPIEFSDSNTKDDSKLVGDLQNWFRRKYRDEFEAVDVTGYSQHTATMDSVASIGGDLGAQINGTSSILSYDGIVDKMFEHGKNMYFKYFDNGLGGDITIFGDYGLQSAQSIDLFDPRNPEVWGEYLITSVSTNWGFQGYRQTCTIGIKIKDSINYIGDVPATDVFEGSSEYAQEYNQNRTA